MNSVTCYKESGFPLLPEITIKNEHNKVVVRKVPVGGEFAKFGVKEGDVIESVNGISFHGFDNNKVFSTLSVMTGDMNIVFQTVVKKEPVTKSKRKQKVNKTVEEHVAAEELAVDIKTLKKEPKSTSKRKKNLKIEGESGAELVNKSVADSLSKVSVNEIESVLDASKDVKLKKDTLEDTEKDHAMKDLKSKEEIVSPASLEECPECDDKFNSITALSEHYTLVHTVVPEEEEPTSPPPVVKSSKKENKVSVKVDPTPMKVKSTKKEKSRSIRKEEIKRETISISEHVEKNEVPVQTKPRVEKILPSEKDSLPAGKKDEEFKRLQAKLKDMKNDRVELNELKKKMESNNALENTLKGLKVEVDKKYKEMTELKNMILNTENQLDGEKELNMKEKDRNKALTEEIKKLKKNQSELQKKLKDSDNKNREYIAKECKEVDANNEINGKLKEIEEENVLLNKKVDNLNKENESLVEETMRKVQKEKEVLQNTIDEKIIEMDKLKNDKSLSEIKIRKLEKQMEACKSKSEKEIETFKTHAEKQMEAFKSTASEMQSKIASMSTDQEKVVSLERDLQGSNEKVVKYKKDVYKLMEKISRKEDVIDGLMKEKKEVDDDEIKKDQTERKLKTYKETILQKSGIISKLEEENLKLLKEKIANLPFSEEKKKTRDLEESLRKVERHNRELNEKLRKIEVERTEREMEDKKGHLKDVIKTNELELKLKDLEKETAANVEKVKKLTGEKERLEEVLQGSTMEAEEKNLLTILKSDVKTLEATNEQNLEKIISLEMEIDKLKAFEKGDNIAALKENIRVVERYNEGLNTKCTELENENRETLNDQMQTLKDMGHLKNKYEALKDKKRDLKDNFEEQSQEMEKLKDKNKVLKKEVAHMSQLQIKLKSLEQKNDSKTDKLQIVEEVATKKSKWEDDSDVSSEEDPENDDWKYVNDTIDEIVDDSEKKKNLSEISEDETDFDSSKFIELAKSKAPEGETTADDSNVIMKLSKTPKVNEALRKAISRQLETKDPFIRRDPEVEVKEDKFANEDLAIRRTFGNEFADKFSLENKSNRKKFEERYSSNQRGGYERSISRRGRDRDIRYHGNRFYRAPNERESYSSYSRRINNGAGAPRGGYSNYHNKRISEHDRSPAERNFTPQTRKNQNDPRRWKQEPSSYGQNSSFNPGSFTEPEQQSKSFAEQVPPPEPKGSAERSPSMDKPSTSTVKSSDITEANFEKRNVNMTENNSFGDSEKKHSLEDGEVDDLANSKRFKPWNTVSKFRPCKSSRDDIRSL